MLNTNYMVDSASKGDFKYLFTIFQCKQGILQLHCYLYFSELKRLLKMLNIKDMVTKLNIQCITYVLDVVKRQGN